jgi:hypothetical protein
LEPATQRTNQTGSVVTFGFTPLPLRGEAIDFGLNFAESSIVGGSNSKGSLITTMLARSDSGLLLLGPNVASVLAKSLSSPDQRNETCLSIARDVENSVKPEPSLRSCL